MLLLGRLLGHSGGQLLLVVCSFAFAVALLVAVLFDAGTMRGAPAVAIAVLFAVNGLARLWLMRRGSV